MWVPTDQHINYFVKGLSGGNMETCPINDVETIQIAGRVSNQIAIVLK